MTELNITGDLTVDEIHKIREYNYELVKDMTVDERIEHYRKGAEEFLQMLEEHRKKRESNK